MVQDLDSDGMISLDEDMASLNGNMAILDMAHQGTDWLEMPEASKSDGAGAKKSCRV